MSLVFKMSLSSEHVLCGVDQEDTGATSEIKNLVSARDRITETFLKEIIDSLPDAPVNSSAVESARLWKDEAKRKITNLSATLSHKVQPIVNLLLEQKMTSNFDKLFSTVATFEPDMCDMATRYRKCFNIWVDDDVHVSFKATNKQLLGKISEKDLYILTFFSFLTCKRTKYDNMLQLGLVGCSTSGKSTLFEACLMEGSHVTTNESGVGRFQVGNKPVLMFHDVNIRTLAISKDTEKIKTIARTEPTVTKIHSTVYTLSPLFLFYSSNERLMSHKFPGPPSRPHMYRFYHSQVDQVGKKRVSEESLLAIQNRFIEAFVSHPPPLQTSDLPQSGGFQRIHAILGLFERIINLLLKYSPADFYSPVTVQYVTSGLVTNVGLYNKIFSTNVDEQVKQLVMKFIQPQQQDALLAQI